MEPITPTQYAAAVKHLAELALTDGSGGRAAARILLSTYNGKSWPVDITELCVLDPDNQAMAMTVIRGRAEIRTEPHDLLKDGRAIIDRIQKQWARYHIRNLWRKECRTCDGRGKVYAKEDYDGNHPKVCPECKGSRFSAEIPEIFQPK
jgi:hypothetical protein